MHVEPLVDGRETKGQMRVGARRPLLGLGGEKLKQPLSAVARI